MGTLECSSIPLPAPMTGSAALEEIHKYLSGCIVQACESQTRKTCSLESLQKRYLNCDLWHSLSSQPGFQSVLHYLTSHAFADFARNVSPPSSPSHPAVSLFLRTSLNNCPLLLRLSQGVPPPHRGESQMGTPLHNCVVQWEVP